MKQLFLLLFFIVGSFAFVEYHGNRRYWTIVDSDGKTNIALHILEESVNLTFPKDKTFGEIVSDMKLYSLVGNEKCQDTSHTSGFTLMFDAQNYIRGEIKVDSERIVTMYMYEKCKDKERTDHYTIHTIENTKSELKGHGRRCFKTRNPIHPYESDATKNVMELQRTRNEFGCQVFMILPEYMQMEDDELPKYNTTELTATFAGHDEKFWWKSKNDSMLPSAVSFDSSENIFINILNSTKEKPYFFRIGSGQPIPAMNFTFGAKCNHSKFELYVNLKPKCFVRVELTDDGFKIATKTSVKNGFTGSLSSMIFGDKHVYVKVGSPLSIKSFKVCDDLSNIFDVPPDQFVLQFVPKKIANGCEKAEVVLLHSDVVNGIEVLIDRSKIKEIINSTTNENSTIFLTTPEVSKSGGFPWYWYLIIGILILGILAAIIILVFCIRRRRRQKTKKSKIPVESVKDEEAGRKTITTKTAVSTEKVSKETKPSKASDEKKVDKKKQKKAKKEATKENNKLSKNKVQPAKIQSIEPPNPLPPITVQPSEEKLVQPIAIQKPKSTPPPPPLSVQPPSAPKPMSPLLVVPAKPLRNLKYRSMYGEDKRTKLDEPYDYHVDESEEFKASVIPAEFLRPDLRIYDNFWDCLGQILKTTMFCRVFADNFFDGNSNVYFMFRDLVAESDLYAPLRSLSNRILEQCENHSQKDVAPLLEKDGKKRVKSDWCYCLRVFVLSYDPLTVEIHCRGPWPHFIFNIFKCDKCRQLFEQLEKNEWKDSPVACDESWDQFICRVKRTPINFHQFLTYYGGFGALEPENPNDIYNVFVFRGEWEQDNLRDCVHGCLIRDDKSHFNECELETSLQKSPSLSK